MRLGVSVDNRRLFDRFGGRGDRKFAYAVQNALNTVGKKAQREIQASIPGKFTVRQRTFIQRQAAKIERGSFASARKNQAFIEIAVGKAPSLALAFFEEGGVLPDWALEFVRGFIPLPVIGGPARPTLARRVPKRYRLTEIQFVGTSTRSGRAVTASNDSSLYLIPGVGIFQRQASGKSRLVYYLWPHLRANQRLGFVRTAQRVAAESFQAEMTAELKKAIAFEEARARR